MNHKYIYPLLIVIICVIFIALCVLIAIPSKAYEGDVIRTVKQDALHEAADALRAAGYAEDSAPIRALSAAWWAEQEALDIVARVVMGEAGSCPFDHQVAVAAVVVNRVNSDLFPNTVRDVVAQPMQYTTLYLSGFDTTPRICYEAAKVALDGTDGVPDDVIWQAEFPQGREIWWRSEVNTGWYASTTFFCRRPDNDLPMRIV